MRVRACKLQRIVYLTSRYPLKRFSQWVLSCTEQLNAALSSFAGFANWGSLNIRRAWVTAILTTAPFQRRKSVCSKLNSIEVFPRLHLSVLSTSYEVGAWGTPSLGFSCKTPMRARRAKADSRPVILLVEDFRPLLLAMQSLLESSQYRVLVAKTSLEALTVEEKFAAPIDLLLTHVLMPGMTGPELFARMRAKFSHISVLYMSDHASGWLDHSAAHEVLSSSLPDPFSSEVLLDRVDGLLHGNAQGVALGGGASPDTFRHEED
jgi:CheY-like chemotaxis protein